MKPSASPCGRTQPAARLGQRLARTSLRVAYALDNQRRDALRQRKPNKAERLAKELRLMISALATLDPALVARLEQKIGRLFPWAGPRPGRQGRKRRP